MSALKPLKRSLDLLYKFDIDIFFIDNMNSTEILFGKHKKDVTTIPLYNGKTWVDEEAIQLLTEIRQKKSISEIAEIHKRTNGAITSKLRALAADYYSNDNKSIDDIMKLTGLERDVIVDTIRRREITLKRREKNIIKTEQSTILPVSKDDSLIKMFNGINERLTALEIKVESLNEKLNKPKILIKKPLFSTPYEFVD
jgi:predicted DNA-binding protein YlxM (UPF0122 family)